MKTSKYIHALCAAIIALAIIYCGQSQGADTAATGGIGAKLNTTNGVIRIENVQSGGPAERAGLKPGWVFVSINGVSTKNMSLDDAVKLIRGPIGTAVKLNVLPPDGAERQLTVKRERLSNNTASPGDQIKPSGPFSGKINRALTMAKESQIYIVPTHEADPAAQQSIQDFVHRIRDRFAPDAPIITDEEALSRNLSTNTVIVYGTVTGNRWLAANFASHPVRIESEKIKVGIAFSGEHLRFITVWPNPGNPNQSLVVYTAQRAEDIVQINSVFHGPTDYVVAEGTKILQAADYEKHDGVWTFPAEVNVAKPSAAERLKTINDLYDKGLMNKDEYEKKKKEIMDSL